MYAATAFKDQVRRRRRIYSVPAPCNGALRVIPCGDYVRSGLVPTIMAIFHLSARPPIARSAGRSATAAAAYRAGVLIVDQRTGLRHDYTARRGVLHSTIYLPGGIQISDHAGFWNSLEMHHKRADAVLAREVVIALPAELTAAQRIALAEQFSRSIADRFGVASSLSVHAPGREGDQRNYHAHILNSACLVASDGNFGKKAVLLDPIHCKRAKISDSVDWLRPQWEQMVNAALAAAGHAERIDHRSNKTLLIEDEPTEHEGWGAEFVIRRARNEAVLSRNQERRSVDSELADNLRARARMAAAEKIREASAATEISEARRARCAADAVKNQEDIAALEREYADARKDASALYVMSVSAKSSALIEDAKNVFMQATAAGKSARMRAEMLSAQMRDTPSWRWIKRKRLAAEVELATLAAFTFSEKAKAAEKLTCLPSVESIKLQLRAADRRASEALVRLQKHQDQLLLDIEPVCSPRPVAKHWPHP